MANTLATATMAKLVLMINRTYQGGWLGISLTYSLEELASSFAITLQAGATTTWAVPFGYQEVEILYEDELLLTGRIENISKGKDGTIQLQGRCRTAILIDASVASPLQYHNVSLHSLASQICRPFGIGVQHMAGQLRSYPNVTLNVDDTCFSAINTMAEKENILLHSSPDGNLQIRRFSEGNVQASFLSDEPNYIDCTATFDGSNRFSHWTFLSQSEADLEMRHTLEDKHIRIHRPKVEIVEATDIATLQDIAKRRFALSVAGSIKVDLALHGWHKIADGSRLLMVGDSIQLQEKYVGLPSLTKFVIATLELSLASGQVGTKLGLALPGQYSGKLDGGAEPWQE